MKARRDTSKHKLKLSCILESTHELVQELEKIDYKLSNSTIAQFFVQFQAGTLMITIICVCIFLR